jgi:hypothetical protein
MKIIFLGHTLFISKKSIVLIYEFYILLRHYATSRKVADSSPDEVEFFHASSRNMALWSTQPLTEMSTRNLPGGKKRPARKADNLTAICEPIV